MESFLETVPKGYRLVFEFRDITWYDSEVYTLLSKYNCAFCIYELDGHRSPEMLTADFTYIRLHGPGRKYEGSYSHEILQDWARKCLQWQETGKDVYLYFDNDQHAYAAFNALELSRLTDVAT